MASILTELGMILDIDDANTEITRLQDLLDRADFAMRVVGANPDDACSCASGTPHNNGLAILEAVRRQNLVT